MLRHFTGQTSTQRLHWQHFRLSISHSFFSLLTARALVGQFFSHSLQKMHLSISFSTLPRVAAVYSLFRCGYISVAGFPTRLLMSVREIPGNRPILMHSPTFQCS